MNQAGKISAETRGRIIAAATELYEKSGRKRLPAVDQVRQLAGVDMDAASVVLKDWRRVQPATAAALDGEVPEGVSQAGLAALEAIWTQAKALANDSLSAAQAAWERERSELDQLRAELAGAFERQAAELDATRRQLSSSLALAAQQAQDLAVAQPQAEAFRERMDKAEARVGELEWELSEAKSQLLRAQSELRLSAADGQAAENALAKLRGELLQAGASAAMKAEVARIKTPPKPMAAPEPGDEEPSLTAAYTPQPAAEDILKFR
ncbi:DNA-binding protein [Chromobacterium haemolyticum]|uniref:DNA-binding protein n=1 Tax=Chromobacterium haemolyticum TaxID=394935 RepID=UPI00244A7349|nr:DNA-binding protein [Chromobacterium haemolyticum]MDH0341820.1 DNA-binding protein [Chromobacterium haemolyticum]